MMSAAILLLQRLRSDGLGLLQGWLVLLFALCLLGMQDARASGKTNSATEQSSRTHSPAREPAPGPTGTDRPPATAARVAVSTVALAEPGEPARRIDAVVEGTLAVVYPDIEEPFRSVFEQIVEGIQSRSRMTVKSYAVRNDINLSELNGMLRRGGTRAVISLGREGVRAAAAIDRDVPLVVSGVLSIPTALAPAESDGRLAGAISLTPDPAILFARLKSLVPSVRRVTVIYNPQRNGWLIKLARDAAKAHGLELVAHEVGDLASAARMYEATFTASDGKRDAVWLPQDTTSVDENIILPLVLRESWNRGVPVFSSSFLHVKKGALFALYPDNVSLGKTLAATVEGALTGEPRRRHVLPLRDVQIAVNLRTASHLGLNISYQQQRAFDLTFPEP